MATEDREYCEHIRQLPCAMSGHGECLGAMHAHHATGGKGLGTRNHDHRTIGLCTKHHTERHALSGPFKGWNKQRIRDWEEATSARLRREYLGLGLEDSLEP
jgi:hypothetical protein